MNPDMRRVLSEALGPSLANDLALIAMLEGWSDDKIREVQKQLKTWITNILKENE